MIGKLRKAEVLLAQCKTVTQVTKHIGISHPMADRFHIAKTDCAKSTVD
jgi:hypothetical protein